MSQDQALDWGMSFEDVPKEEFQQLEDGEYQFVVSDLQQDRWGDNVKSVGGFPYAKVFLAILENGEQIASVQTNLTLSTRNQWRLREFFASLGFPIESGKAFTPHWNKVIGRKGLVELKKDEFKGRNGDIIKTNKVSKFLPPKVAVDAADIPADDDLEEF